MEGGCSASCYFLGEEWRRARFTEFTELTEPAVLLVKGAACHSLIQLLQPLLRPGEPCR